MLRLILILPLLLKVYCFVHAYKSGKPQWWFWVISLVPFGSFYYLFTEVLSVSRTKSSIGTVQNAVADKIEPTRRITQLEAQLEYSDTITNRIVLADEYLNPKSSIETSIPIINNCKSVN